MLKNAGHSHFLRMDRHASPPFMRPINICSRISAVPQSRSNAGVCSWGLCFSLEKTWSFSPHQTKAHRLVLTSSFCHHLTKADQLDLIWSWGPQCDILSLSHQRWSWIFHQLALTSGLPGAFCITLATIRSWLEYVAILSATTRRSLACLQHVIHDDT